MIGCNTQKAKIIAHNDFLWHQEFPFDVNMYLLYIGAEIEIYGLRFEKISTFEMFKVMMNTSVSLLINITQ